MELELNDKQYFVGDALSLADIALFAYMRNAPLGAFDRADYPDVNAWISRIAAELRARGQVQFSATEPPWSSRIGL